MIEQSLIKTLGFGSQVFIERAVKGGYSITDLAHRLGVKNISAVEVGKSYIVVASHQGNRKQLCSFETILLPPAAWKAVGKVEGWTRGIDPETGETMLADPSEVYEQEVWLDKWHSFIDAIAEEEGSKA